MDSEKARPIFLKDLDLPKLPQGKDGHIYPRVEQAFWIHEICNRGPDNAPELVGKFTSYIESNNLAYLYRYIAQKNIIKFDEAKYEQMKAIVERNVKKITEAISKLGDGYDEMDMKEMTNLYSNYLSFIGDKESSLQYLEDSYKLCDSKTIKIENHLHRCRIGFFYQDRKLVRNSLEIATELIKNTSDWHLKNIHYAYSALNCLWNRDIKGACTFFLNCVSSFCSYDVMPLSTFCSYTAVCAMLTLSREKFYQNVVNGSEVQEGLYNVPVVKLLSEAFYTCDYGQFTKNLKLLIISMHNDPFIYEHIDYLCKQFRLKAYTQLLVSFKSLTLKYLSDVFGLSENFIEMDVARFIAKGELNCKIDLVRGMVITSHLDNKNKKFQEFLLKSDNLLSNIRYMERMIRE